MANTKITTNVIADGAITSAKLDSSSLSIPSTATATTQSAGDNSTKVATTAYVETAVSNLISAAPAALDTLDELAAALGDDANFSTTITNSLALKAPLASPDFTGDVTFDTSTLVVDSTNNRVGIGIASPSHPLHVSGASGATQAFFNTTSGNTNFQIKVTEDAGTVLISKDNTAARSLSFQIGESNVAMTIDTSGDIAVSGTVDGRDIASDGSKLDGIESGATADQTASEILTAIKTVDGSGSGLDADLLDGISSASYLRSDANDTYTGTLSLATNSSIRLSNQSGYGIETSDGFRVIDSVDAVLRIGDTGKHTTIRLHGGGNDDFRVFYGGADYEIWHAGNDGAGSGLDADLLDGVQGSSYLRSDTSDTFTTLSGTQLNLGSQVQLRESTDRPDLLQITSSTSTWAGLQVRNSSNEGRWSFMTDGSVAGIYDDENGKWHIQMDENGETRLYNNATERITATSVGADVLGQLYVDSTTDAKFILQGSADPYMVFKEGTTDKCHIGWDSTNTRIFFTAVEDNSGGGAQGNFIFKSGDADDPLKIALAASDSDIYGYVYAEHGNTIGFLDQDANWAIKHVRDSRTEFYDNNSLVFSIGQGANLGDFGSVATCDGGKGGWAGYSIEGRVVFMHDIDTNSWGIYNDVNNEWMILGDLNGTVGLRYNGTSRLETTSGGAKVIGDFDISGNLNNVTDIYVDDQIIHTGDTNTYMQFHAADQWRVVTGGTERLEVNNSLTTIATPLTVQGENNIFSNGNAGIYFTNGGTSPTFASHGGIARSAGTNFHVSGSAVGDLCISAESGKHIMFGDANTQNARLEDNGNFIAAGSVTGSSDERLKDNVQTIQNALEKTMGLRGVTFTRNDIVDSPEKIGVIAQEVEQILPQVVVTAEDEDGYKSVAYGEMVALLIEATKEQQALIETLQTRIETLEGNYG